MAWVAPRTWVEELANATQINTDLKDDMLWLKTPPLGVDTVASASTTSSTFSAISGLSVVLSTTGGNVLLLLMSSVATTVGARSCFLDFGIDGARQSGSSGLLFFTTNTANAYKPVLLWFITSTPPIAGSHTYTVWWKTDPAAPTLSVQSNNTWLYVMEIG